VSIEVRPGGASPRVELWVRDTTAYGVADRVRAVHDRLRKLERRGDLSEVDLNVWGRAVSVSGDSVTDISGTIGAKIDEFVDWAEREEQALEPAFAVRKRNPVTVPGSETVLSLPLVCLAVYDEDDLLAVFPHTDDDDVRRVHDCLDGLERGASFLLSR